jgi:hypothetical protein
MTKIPGDVRYEHITFVVWCACGRCGRQVERLRGLASTTMALTDLAYRLYERRLTAELSGGPLPQHVGVIIDGNRRYAAERGLGTASDGHAAGARRIDPFLDWCLELGIGCVTLWLLSTEISIEMTPKSPGC